MVTVVVCVDRTGINLCDGVHYTVNDLSVSQRVAWFVILNQITGVYIVLHDNTRANVVDLMRVVLALDGKTASFNIP